MKVQVTQLEKTDGSVTECDKEAADELCMFFKSVFIDDQDLKPPEPTMHHPPATISVSATCFSRDSVLQKLKGLHSDKSPGPDGLHPMVLKECAEEIAESLSTIFTQSYNSGTVPDYWRLANIVPIFKKGKRAEVGNYRPVSLTCVSCKVMEG